MFRLVFLFLFSSIICLNDICDNKIFILISKNEIYLFNFNTENNSSLSNIIYQTKLNTTIENTLFNKQTNTIILLINQLNQIYSIYLLSSYDNIYDYWIEQSTKIIYSSYIYLSISQRYLYILNNQTMLLQIFTFPLTSTAFKENNLLNLPKNKLIINYLIDEKFHFLWILFEDNPYQIYICQLKTYLCYLYMNIFNINKPIQFIINWNYQKLYLYSKNNLIIYEYNHNQTNYLIQYFNFTEDHFLTICEKTNSIEYISINKRQICYQTCQNLPLILNNTNPIDKIQRLSSLSDILYCSKQRKMRVIIWLAFKYNFQSKLNQNSKQMSSGTISMTEKEIITHF